MRFVGSTSAAADRHVTTYKVMRTRSALSGKERPRSASRPRDRSRGFLFACLLSSVLDLDLLGLAAHRFGNCDLEHTVLHRRLHLARIDSARELNRAIEHAIRALGHMEVLFLILVLFLDRLFAANGQDIVIDG